MQRSLIIALLLIVITVVFALQNSNPVTIRLFFWTVNIAVAYLIPVAVLFGALLGVLFSLPTLHKRAEKIRELKKEKSEQEITAGDE
jgi:uncharacterized integral membrane protein